MSVDFYGCESCGDSRYEEYVGACNGCHNSLCTNCLVDNDYEGKDSNYAHVYGYRFDSKNEVLMKRYEEEGFTLYQDDGTAGYNEGDIIDDSGIDRKYCPFCSGNEVDREAAFCYLLEKHKLTAEGVWKEMKAKNNGE